MFSERSSVINLIYSGQRGFLIRFINSQLWDFLKKSCLSILSYRTILSHSFALERQSRSCLATTASLMFWQKKLDKYWSDFFHTRHSIKNHSFERFILMDFFHLTRLYVSKLFGTQLTISWRVSLPQNF